MLALEAPAWLRLRLDSDKHAMPLYDLMNGVPVNGQVELVLYPSCSPVRILLLEEYDALLKRIIYTYWFVWSG